MRQKFEHDAVDKVVRYIQDNPDGLGVLGKRIGLWRFPKLKNMLSDSQLPQMEACKLFLQPDIDILLSQEAELAPKLIGVEVKAIYIRKREQANIEYNIKYYEGLDEAIALLRFGLDAVRLFQVFIVQLTDQNARERVPKSWVEYQIPMRDVIRTLHLPIGYTPSLDFAIGDQLSPDPFQVLDLKDSHAARYGEKIILPSPSNPFLNSSLQYPRVVRKFLLEEYLQKHHGSK
jgi:hypothetical protein